MIYPAHIPFPASATPATLATKPKSPESASSTVGSSGSLGATVDSGARTCRAAEENRPTDPAFPAGVPPLADERQAAAATQRVSLLLRAQPGLALAAQANASSQSVQRLLQ